MVTREELIEKINTSDNMTLVRSNNTFEKYAKQRLINNVCDETSLFFSEYVTLAENMTASDFIEKKSIRMMSWSQG